MPDILSLIYRGEYEPKAAPFQPTEKYLMKKGMISQLEDDFFCALSGEMKDKINQYVRLRADTEEMERQYLFEEGFRMGVQLMTAALSERDE